MTTLLVVVYLMPCLGAIPDGLNPVFAVLSLLGECFLVLMMGLSSARAVMLSLVVVQMTLGFLFEPMSGSMEEC